MSWDASTNDDPGSPRSQVFADDCKGLNGLHEHVNTRNTHSKKNFSDLEERRAQVRDGCQVQMILLKELELERIDLQMTVHRLASMRQNWKAMYADHQLTPSPEVDQRLAEEERLAVSEVQKIDSHIGLVSAQVARLREVRDAIDRKLSEKRHHLHLEGKIIEQCSFLLQRPFTVSHKPRSGRITDSSLRSIYGESTPRFPQLPQSAR